MSVKTKISAKFIVDPFFAVPCLSTIVTKSRKSKQEAAYRSFL